VITGAAKAMCQVLLICGALYGRATAVEQVELCLSNSTNSNQRLTRPAGEAMFVKLFSAGDYTLGG